MTMRIWRITRPASHRNSKIAHFPIAETAQQAAELVAWESHEFTKSITHPMTNAPIFKGEESHPGDVVYTPPAGFEPGPVEMVRADRSVGTSGAGVTWKEGEGPELVALALGPADGPARWGGGVGVGPGSVESDEILRGLGWGREYPAGRDVIEGTFAA